MADSLLLFEVAANKRILTHKLDENVIEGHFDEIHWANLRALGELNVAVISVAQGINAADFEIQNAFILDGRGSWLPVIRVYLKPGFLVPEHQLKQLLVAVSGRLLPQNAAQESLFQLPDLNDDAKRHIDRFLVGRGDKRITEELTLKVGGAEVVKLGGVYASKSVDQINDEPITVQAKIDVLCNSNRSAVLIVASGGARKKLSICFEEEWRGRLAECWAQNSMVSVIYTERLDGKGVRFLDLNGLEPLKSAEFELTWSE